jgi:hypothetical protein
MALTIIFVADGDAGAAGAVDGGLVVGPAAGIVQELLYPGCICCGRSNRGAPGRPDRVRSRRGDFLDQLGGIPCESQTLCSAWSLVKRVAALFEMLSTEVLREGKYARTVEAGSVLCYRENQELGISTVEPARRLKLLSPR